MRPWITVIACLFLAGCFGTASSPAMMSQAAAEQAVSLAGQRLDQDLASGHEIRLMTIDMDLGEGAGAMSIMLEWGQGDVTHFFMDADFGDGPSSMEVYCSPDGTIVIQDEERFEQEGDQCPDVAEMWQDQFDIDEYLRTDGLNVTPTPDGGADADFSVDGASGVLHIDGEGRLVSVNVATEMGGVDMVIDYGARQAIAAP